MKQLAMCKQFIIQTIDKNITNYQDTCVLFCGDLGILAEIDNTLKEKSTKEKKIISEKEEKIYTNVSGIKIYLDFFDFFLILKFLLYYYIY